MTDESLPRWVLRRAGIAVAGLVLVILAAVAYASARAFLADPEVGGRRSLTAPDVRTIGPADAPLATIRLADSLFGRSGALRFATLTAADAAQLPGFLASFGEAAIHRPAALPILAGQTSFTLFVLRPFGQKRGDVLNGYRLGRWPAERWLMQRNYFNPDGFVEVTRADSAASLSTHFTMADFLMHDRQQQWPRYVLLEERLIDKLELVLQELGGRGVRAGRVRVLSGFRAPYYNELQIEEGAARASRHQFGDAADVLIDDDGDGRMDDLNGDGRVDLRDMRAITDAVERVERRFPDLAGGLGTYAAMGPSGPFAHVDVRGTSARWERGR